MKGQDLVVVITGASSGIGRATALELAKKGASLVLAARRRDALDEVARECRNLGGTPLVIPTDVSKENEVNFLASTAVTRFGRIDVWINDAAVTVAGKVEDIPMDDFRKVIDVNFFGYLYGARAVIPVFKKQRKGLLINVSSMVALRGQPYFTPYTVSKFAIRGLSLSLSEELADEENIHVSCVLPAVIDTPIFNHGANYMGKAMKAPGHVIPAEDVADAILGLIDKPKKEILVGAASKLTALGSVFAPDLVDQQIKKKIEAEHFTDEYADDTTGNLYETQDDAAVSGGWKEAEEEHKTGFILKAVLPVLAAGAAIGGLAAVFRK